MTSPIAKIGDLAAEAGIERIHVLAWRDLDDVEAGGSEVHAAHVCRLWAEAGLEVVVRTSFAQGHPPRVVRDGYEVVRRAGRYLVFPRAALSELRGKYGHRDALVEIWNGMPFFSPIWARGPRLTFLHHVHGDMWRMVLPPNLAAVGDTIERTVAPLIYRRTQIVTLSESSKADVVRQLRFSPDRVAVVPPGIDERFVPGGTLRPTPHIVAVGRLVPVKRFDLLIRVVARVRHRVPDVHLTIVGEGYERLALQACIDELDLTDHVTLHGRASDAELVELYQSSWVVASASSHEGWGMSVTEAASCHTPAVVTDIAGHRDAVVDGVTGLLAADEDALVDALVEVCTDRSRRDALADAALTHAERYSWPATAAALMKLLADDAARRR